VCLAYGLRIAANVPIPGLPLQAGAEATEAVDLWVRLKDPPRLPSPADPSSVEFFYSSAGHNSQKPPALRVGLLAGGAYFGFFYGDGAQFFIERHGREVWADWPENYTLEDACTYLVGPVLGFVLRLRGVVCLHASAIALGDQAIVLVGFPGAGKSTTAAAFAHRGFSVLSDDVVALGQQQGRLLVQPGYPRLNLWPDSVRALYGAEDALPRITPTWGKRWMALDSGKYCFVSQPLSLGAIYILGERQADLSVPVVEEVAGCEALMALVTNSYVNYLLDLEMRRRELDVLGQVVSTVPVRNVRPSADPSNVFLLCDTIAADANRILVPASRRDDFRSLLNV
jgi:hypothetical protein